ncbi:MAG: class I mannose-6-phosphate isomerase [Bacteroidales bacterium]|nr:class I mannose-6-phosphate isomerase [Bacteroidales bacterium]
MEDNKKLYPLKFIPIPSRRPWGGDSLIKVLGKSFVETDEEGNETPLTVNDLIGESWELADMGAQDSVVEEGWLAGNTIGEIMETYIDRVVGESVFNWYGTQFPLLIKFLDINDKLSVQVHPDDAVAEERYDSLGKAEIWYVMDAKPGAKVYMGFNRPVSAQELYDRCHNGTVEEVLNVITPKKGDSILITPGTVHAADGGILIAEIQESSDMTFRLYDWGREFNPATARKMHLDEAMDVINYDMFDAANYRKGPAWGTEEKAVEVLAGRPEFTVTKYNLTEPLKVSTEQSDSFMVYVCPAGEAAIEVPSGAGMDNYILHKGETILVPAEVGNFFVVPRDKDTIVLEAYVARHDDTDMYIDPSTEPFLPGEDYEGIDKEEEDEDE